MFRFRRCAKRPVAPVHAAPVQRRPAGLIRPSRFGRASPMSLDRPWCFVRSMFVTEPAAVMEGSFASCIHTASLSKPPAQSKGNKGKTHTHTHTDIDIHPCIQTHTHTCRQTWEKCVISTLPAPQQPALLATCALRLKRIGRAEDTDEHTHDVNCLSRLAVSICWSPSVSLDRSVLF